MTQLDLRPAPGTMVYELLRLGFVFDHSNGDGSCVWMKYPDNLRSDAASMDATEVTFTDMTSKISKVVTIADLSNIDSVLTWTNANPTETTKVEGSSHA